MKTAEEIKKGLECCAKGNSCRGHCPYDGRSAGIKECTSQLARDALTLIPRWISVEERLPEKNSKVLVLWVGHAIEAESIGDGYVEPLGDRLILAGREFTHWMPLPEPPKEE